MKQSFILIVEDEYLIADSIEGTLREFGFEHTLKVSNAKRALLALEEEIPALVIMDIRLGSGADGIELAIDIRDRYGSQIVFVTGNSEAETIARARIVEPSGYLIKPFSPQELRAAVEIALYKYQSHPVVRPPIEAVSVVEEDSVYSELSMFLSEHPCFQELSADAINALASCSHLQRYKKNDHLFIAGDTEVTPALVISGWVVLLKSNTEGKEVVVELLHRGHCMGLYDGLKGHEKEVSARALSDTQVLSIPPLRFQRLLDLHPLMYRDLMLHAAERIQMTQQFSHVMALESLQVKIAFVLMLMRKHCRGNSIVVTREQLAHMTGSTVESVIRNTRMLEDEGILDLQQRGRIDISDSRRLGQLIEML